jgi:hypothetical protein
MRAKVIFYSQKELEPKERTKFKKELAGHNDASHGGRYGYRINGVLDKIQHIKPSNAALILKLNDYKKVLSLMKKHAIKYTVYSIEVPKTHLKNK